MGRRNNTYANALADSFFATFGTEPLHRDRSASRTGTAPPSSTLSKASTTPTEGTPHRIPLTHQLRKEHPNHSARPPGRNVPTKAGQLQTTNEPIQQNVGSRPPADSSPPSPSVFRTRCQGRPETFRGSTSDTFLRNRSDVFAGGISETLRRKRSETSSSVCSGSVWRKRSETSSRVRSDTLRRPNSGTAPGPTSDNSSNRTSDRSSRVRSETCRLKISAKSWGPKTAAKARSWTFQKSELSPSGWLPTWYDWWLWLATLSARVSIAKEATQ